ncbi:hypothetical protein [Pyxidicoccus sp. MSG2]|uniref:hypothetical protein n=1 Tax=Pyxidicoccus sp. MSG2 TaxID=2996790 RepID=UPI00227124DC|nr:hypothetical protein [Pyxidicoccus sp. MSG2]MCY1018171.1 hypothetical protein [Pyxidicoccus sp. MSG2]
MSAYASWITQKTNTAPLYSYTLYNPYFSGTYMYLTPNNDYVSLFLNKYSTFTVCAREGSVSGGPFTQGARCG